MFKSGARRGMAAAVIVLAAAVVQLVGPSAAHAANPQCDGAGVIIRNQSGDPYSAWIPAYRSSNFNCWLLRGSNNSGVGHLQRALNYDFRGRKGYTLLDVDNDFGSKTEAALRFAQTYWHDNFDSTIKIDGGYGSQTRNMLCWPDMNGSGCVHYLG
ncbi:peptidoglycan-binding domain-containing protein [Catellatospora paridis]|uniref:peptidoglycan-binding domain-containing protein n=1 Tax=Catellatospora paridis TaxID=1617086 RepID=UPI0012D3BE89|nr:peptidoglycan-binding domain-containing protein [Catellatospora paridis]